jgi:hypothetical protein
VEVLGTDAARPCSFLGISNNQPPDEEAMRSFKTNTSPARVRMVSRLPNERLNPCLGFFPKGHNAVLKGPRPPRLTHSYWKISQAGGEEPSSERRLF